MNPFKNLLNDTVFIQKPGGERSVPFKTAITYGREISASIFEGDLDVEEGWRLVRPLPNGKDEFFVIIDANYSQGLKTIPPHWTLKLTKESSFMAEKPRGTTINISNSSGIQIGDHNVQHIANGIVGLIEKIEVSSTSDDEKKVAKGSIRAMLENPTIAAVMGSAVSGALALLG